jgi:hypothetical protein
MTADRSAKHALKPLYNFLVIVSRPNAGLLFVRVPRDKPDVTPTNPDLREMQKTRSRGNLQV